MIGGEDDTYRIRAFVCQTVTFYVKPDWYAKPVHRLIGNLDLGTLNWPTLGVSQTVTFSP